jgi:hypothetical protein
MSTIDLPTSEPEHSQRKPRRWPWIVGIVAALVVGATIGAAGQTEPEVTQARIETVEVDNPDLQRQIAMLESQLATAESKVAERDELETRAAELDALATELEAREEAVGAAEETKAANTIPGPGIYVVGEDIKPGEYRTTGDDCYWARLSGLSGELDDIIVNGFADGPAVLTIAKSDVAFENSCGEWVRQ